MEILKRLQKNDGSSRTCKYSHDRNTNTIVLKIQISKFCKGWKVVERCLTSDSGQETWWKRSNLRYSWNSKKGKKHNNKNEVNANRYLAAI